MSSPLVIQANYDQLQRIAQRFAEQSQQIAALRNDLSHRTSALRDGDWEGQGAIAFFAEMDRDLLPGLLRLREALQEASEVTLAIRTLLQVAEEEAAALFTNGAAADGAADGRDFWWNARDFLSGMWAEAKETVEGTITMVRHPIQSAQALLYGIRHPGELWNAIKQPYVEDWNNGHKWRAIGRGTMAIIAAAVGSKGVDKVAKLAKAGRFGGGASRAASAAARFGSFRRVVAGAKVSKIDNVLDLLRPSTARATRVADEIAEAVNKGLPYDHLMTIWPTNPPSPSKPRQARCLIASCWGHGRSTVLRISTFGKPMGAGVSSTIRGMRRGTSSPVSVTKRRAVASSGRSINVSCNSRWMKVCRVLSMSVLIWTK
ncbi:MAG: WXG100 family type VII secretion target [Ardenticatenales bacterium]|nr:WXG100 family type VII secretion target [Ardenticatenales bacterium]MCB9172694.1 WXG100 family type VII secretion target [Ardenticatenales bacterium]